MTNSCLEGLLNSAAAYAAVQASKDKSGKPDPYKAVGMLFGAHGSLFNEDIAELGAMLGADSAFNDDSE